MSNPRQSLRLANTQVVPQSRAALLWRTGFAEEVSRSAAAARDGGWAGG